LAEKSVLSAGERLEIKDIIMPTLALNKRAAYDYELLERFTAGLVLSGQEVKSAKAGQASLRGAFVTARTAANGRTPDFFLTNARIAAYKQAGPLTDYDPLRSRRLLLKRGEMIRLVGKKNEAGLTFVPLKLYTKKSLIKLEFCLAKGKKKYDKRRAIKKREIDREIKNVIKNKK